MFSTSSYCDRMGITFVSDSSMIPDSRVLRRHLDEAVKKVEQYLLEKEKANRYARLTVAAKQWLAADGRSVVSKN